MILIVLDGCGVGPLPDAAAYGSADSVSATLVHVAEAAGGLRLPVLQSLGLGNIAPISGIEPSRSLGGWGKMVEASAGKDSVTGHWEMMGIITKTPFPTYPQGFASDLISRFETRIGRQVLGNVAASGTEIIKRLGAEHVATGKPIVYTSADSVFQIAAHEAVVPLPELYVLCEAAREMLAAPHDILRVIARPFVGGSPETFRRTDNRRDYPLRPPRENVLQALVDAGRHSQAIGVIADLFPSDLFTAAERTQNNPAHFAAILHAVQTPCQDFVFANCEDFDMLFGHRNDPLGFAAALEAFDAALGDIVAVLQPDDLLLLAADHGNDPTTESTDHSREYVPLLAVGAGLPADSNLGTRSTFADIGATVADWLSVPWFGPGQSVLGHPPQGF